MQLSSERNIQFLHVNNTSVLPIYQRHFSYISPTFSTKLYAPYRLMLTPQTMINLENSKRVLMFVMQKTNGRLFL